MSLSKYLQSIDDERFDNNKNIEAQFRFVLTQLCNEKCFFCHNEWLPVDSKYMQFEFYKKIIDVIADKQYPQRIRFTWWEPFLHKELFRFIEYARSNLKNNIWITTNGLLLKKNYDNIINSWLDSLTISLHSLDREKYKNITKIDWLIIVMNGIYKLKDKFWWKIKINCVVDNSNINELWELYEFTKENNITLKILNILDYGNSIDKENIMNLKEIKNWIMEEWLIWLIKADRTKPKCINCDKYSLCAHEAEYLRITPWWDLNPCLWKKEYNINLNNLSNSDFEKGIMLWLYRVENLDL